MLRRFELLLWGLLTTLPLWGQEPVGSYYPYAFEEWEPDQPMIQSDTTLFYHAIQQPHDLYGEQTRYHTFTESHRRGEAPYDQPLTLDGLPITATNFYLLRSLANASHEESAISPFAPPHPASHQVQVRYNDLRYRLGVRYRTHLALPHNWQMGLQVEGRLGRDRFTKGVYTRTLRAALRLEKGWQSGIRLALLATAAPTEQGLAGNSTSEAFTLIGDPYYNPDWGFDRDKERSARVRRTFRPLVAASMELPLGAQSHLRVTATGEWGAQRMGTLGWFDASTPEPDNYRLMPSYFDDPTTREAVASEWRAHNSRYTQINWEELRRQNSLSTRGAYYVEQDRVEVLTRLQLRVEAESELQEHLTLRYGLSLHQTNRRHYQEVRDLLGAAYLLDIDHYLIDDDTYANQLQNDLRNPSRRVMQGDRFGYDYTFEERAISLHAAADYRTDRWHLVAQAEIGSHQIQRRGYYEKELFPGNGSYGRSQALHFAPYRLGMQIGYAFSPRRLLMFCATSEARSPLADDLFLQPQYNNRPIDNPSSERLHDLSLTYRESGSRLKWSATAFLRMERNRSEVGRYYDDLSALFCDQVARGIGTGCYGVEAAAILYLGRSWQLQGAVAWQETRYTQNPHLWLYSDTDNRLILQDAESYMGECRPGGVARYQAVLGTIYYGKSWGVRLTMNFLGGRYAHPDYMRRTVRVAWESASSEEAYSRFMEQERIEDGLRCDLSCWKSFRIGAYRLIASLSIENLLGDQTTPYTQYESHRLRRRTVGDRSVWQPLDSQLRYASPRTLLLSLSLKI